MKNMKKIQKRKNLANVKSMYGMFNNASAFNQDIGSRLIEGLRLDQLSGTTMIKVDLKKIQ